MLCAFVTEAKAKLASAAPPSAIIARRLEIMLSSCCVSIFAMVGILSDPVAVTKRVALMFPIMPLGEAAALHSRATARAIDDMQHLIGRAFERNRVGGITGNDAGSADRRFITPAQRRPQRGDIIGIREIGR